MPAKRTAIVIPTFNRPENIQRLLHESDIPEDSLIVVSSASNIENAAKEKEILRSHNRECVYLSESDWEDISNETLKVTGEPALRGVLMNKGYGLGRQVGYWALMARGALGMKVPDVVFTIDDDHVLPVGYVGNVSNAVGKTMPEIREEILANREVFISGDATKPVKSVVGYYLWLEHLGFLETMLPEIERTVQTPGVSPSSISKRVEMLKGYSLDPKATYYDDSKTGKVLLTETGKSPMFKTMKTYYGGGNYAFAGELLPDMTFKGPMPGRIRYIDDQLLFWGILPYVAKDKDGIAIWGNCAEFANLHYPAKRDAISGIESDLTGRTALSVLFEDFKPTSDDRELSQSFGDIAKAAECGKYDSMSMELRREYIGRLNGLRKRFKSLPQKIVDSVNSIYPCEYSALFEEQANSLGDFMKKYEQETRRIGKLDFNQTEISALFENLSQQYALRGMIVESIPAVAKTMKKYLEPIGP
ncbi:MAG: glycosyltransferase family A protein [Candidatus Aenigmatarchaeota archaeon]